ncbi:MAG: sulfite exporter TauE/SafE family protein [Azospirillaceae bacterium]
MPTLFDLTLYEGVSLWGVAAVCLIVFCSFFIKGAIGIGSLTPIVIFSAFILSPHHAVLLALVVNLVSQVQFIPTAIRFGDWTVARRVFISNFIGAAIGIWIFGQVSSAELALILGAVLGGIVVADLAGLVDRVGRRWDVTGAGTVWALSGLAGLISGITGAGGLLFLALYLRTVCADRLVLRGTIMLLSTLVVFWRAIVLTASGLIDLTLVAEGTLLIPLVILGGYAGARLFRRLNEARFAMLLRAVVLVGALGLVWRGLGDLM